MYKNENSFLQVNTGLHTEILFPIKDTNRRLTPKLEIALVKKAGIKVLTLCYAIFAPYALKIFLSWIISWEERT